MGEFIVNESGCSQLCDSIDVNIKSIAGIILDIESNDGNLRAALGDDYDGVAKAVAMMKAELKNAHSELIVILSCMDNYLERIHQANEILK